MYFATFTSNRWWLSNSTVRKLAQTGSYNCQLSTVGGVVYANFKSFNSVPPAAWELVSGVIIMLLGASLVWPNLWEAIGVKLNIKAGKLLGSASKNKGILGDILIGAALGPVFTSCSPTYALIVASILPVSFGAGLIYLLIYSLGMAIFLLIVALIGQKIISQLNWASNPRGWFKRTIGVVFIVIGILIATGLQKQIEAYLVGQGWYDPFSRIEQSLMR